PPSRPGPPYYPPRFPSDHPNRKRNQQQRRRTTTPAPTPLPPPPTQPPPPKVWTTRPPVIVPVWQPQHQPLPVTPHQNAYRPFSYQHTNAWAPVKPTEASYPYNQHHQQQLQNPTGWQQQHPSYPNNRNFGGAAGGFVKPLDFGKFIQKMGVSMTSPEFRPPSSNHNPHHPEYHVPHVLVSNTTASRTDPVIIISRRRRRSAPTSTQASQNEPPPEDLPWLTCFLCETEDGDFAEDCEYGRDEDDDDFGTDASFITPSRANRTTGSGTHRKPEHEYYDPREFNDDDVKFDDADFAFDDAYEAIAKSTRPEEPKSEEEEEPEVTTEAAQQNTEQPETKEEPANSESRYQTVVEPPTQIFGVVSARNPKPDGNFRKNSSEEETFSGGSESRSSDFEAGTKLSPIPTVFTEQEPGIDPKETPGKQGRVRIMKRKLTPKNLPKTASTLLETQREIKLPSDDSLCWQQIEMQLNSGHIRRKRTLCSDNKQVPKGSVPQKLQKMRVSEPPLKQFSRSRRNSGDENLHVKIKFRKNDPQRGLHVKTYEYKKGKSVVHSSSEFPRSNRRHQVKKDDDDSDSRREEPSSIRRNPHRGPLTSFIPAGYIKRSDASPTPLHHGNASTRERVPEIPAEEPSKEGPEEDDLLLKVYKERYK
ncbi:unnamed protein product, partial [Notodromas monacha]